MNISLRHKAALTCLLSAACATSVASERILLGLDKPSIERAAQLVGAFGKVVGKGENDKIFVVELKHGKSLDYARKELQNKQGIRFVMDAEAHLADMTDLKSVREHLNYRRAKAGLNPAKKDGGERLSIWEAFEYFLSLRTDKTGKLDLAAYNRALAHRKNMQRAVIGGGSKGALDPSGTWSYVGPRNVPAPYNQYFGVGPVAGRVTSIAVDPTDANTIYIGSANGGVWKTIDGGTTWTSKSGSDWEFLYVSSVAVDPANPQVVYAGTGDYRGFFGLYAKGIMKSTDGGNTWSHLTGTNAFGTSVAVSKIIVSPDNSNVVLATTTEMNLRPRTADNGGVWRSTDGGTTWTQRNPPSRLWLDMDYGIKNGQNVRRYWAVGSGTWGGGNAYGTGNIWTSVDDGATWSQCTNVDTNPARTYDVAASKTDPDTAYLLAPNFGKIWKTTTAGVGAWTDITTGFPFGNPSVGTNYNWSQSEYDYHISTSSVTQNGVTKDGVYVGLITLAMSPDGGSTWVDISKSYDNTGNSRMHSDQHSFANHPTDPNTVFVGGDGGIFKYVHNPALNDGTFTSLNEFIGITQFYKMTLHPSDTNFIIGGSQDNSSPASLGNLNSWGNPGAGDGGFTDISNVNPQVQFLTSQNANVFVTKNGWATGRNWLGNFDGTAQRAFIAPVQMSNDGADLFVGTQYFNKWNVASESWSIRIGGKNFTYPLMFVGTAPNDNNRVVVSNFYLWYSDNQGTSWTQADGGASPLPLAFTITCVNTHPTNKNDVLVTFAGTGQAHVYRCADISQPDATRVWVNVSGTGLSGLPDVPAHAIARDPFYPDTIWYVANDLGVFMTTNGGSTWTNATAPLGLPNVSVHDLKISHDNYLYAATFGRGIWRIKLADPAQVAVDSVTVQPWIVVGGQGFQGTVNLSSVAGPGGTVVTLSDDTGSIDTPPTVVVPQGSSSATFNCTTSTVLNWYYRKVFAQAGGVTKEAFVKLIPVPKLDTLTLAATTVVGGSGTTATVSLQHFGEYGGTQVAVSTNSSAITVPSAVTVPENTKSKSFNVGTQPVTASATRNITATLNGSSRTAQLTLTPTSRLSALTLNPGWIIGGNGMNGVITLTGPAPAGGATVAISSNSGSISVPASTVVTAGASARSFPVTTSAVSAVFTRQVTVSYLGLTKTASLTLYPKPALNTLSLNPTSVTGGGSSTGTVSLVNVAPPSGVVVTLSDNSGAIHTPASATVLSGASNRTFTVTTSVVSATATRQVIATLNGVTRTANLTLTP